MRGPSKTRPTTTSQRGTRSSRVYWLIIGNEALVDSLPGVPGGSSFVGTSEPGAGIEDDLLVKPVEVLGHPAENLVGELGPVAISVQLAIRGLPHPQARCIHFFHDRPHGRHGTQLGRSQRRRLEHPLDARKLGLEAREGLSKQAESLVQAGDGRAETRGWLEVHDRHVARSTDSIQSADPLLDDHWIPRKVEEHDPIAELEVAPLAPALGGDEQARPLGPAETRHLDVAPRRRQLFVEHRRGDLAATAEAGAEPLERLPVCDENEALLAPLLPTRRLRQHPR